MMSKSSQLFKVALVGNPNSGKSSLFNSLTGLQQHVANFPGVTVDKKTSLLKIDKDIHILLTDFPGAYSLYPNSDDERVVAEILSNPSNQDYPDAVIYVADPFDLKRQLLLFTQIKDLGIPVLMVLTMKDLADKKELSIDSNEFKRVFNSHCIFFSSKTKENLENIKIQILEILQSNHVTTEFYKLSDQEFGLTDKFRDSLSFGTPYQGLVQIHNSKWLDFIDRITKDKIDDVKKSTGFNDTSSKINETLERFRFFEIKLNSIIKFNKSSLASRTEKLDKVLTHRIIGPLIFFIIMFMVFQAVFSLASYPMDAIESGFMYFSDFVSKNFNQNWLTELIADGILPGLSGVLVFIPQIFILFLIIGIMEEMGYMSRVIFMFDDVMRKFGMNGRSLVALISGGACAVPAIMSTRTINNWKERLITILVTPLISCSARIPVYSLLVLFAVPDTQVWGFNLRGITLMGLYLTGIFMAMLSSLVLKNIVKSRSSSFLILSLPEYKRPIFKNIALFVKEKLGAFVFGAGKIIILISIVIWVLAKYGPGNDINNAKKEAIKIAADNKYSEQETENLIAAKTLESSYIGVLGKSIEPLIQPLGFDWKIGIAIVTSFAAREVFVGTMSTIYSLGNSDDNVKISERMKNDIHPVSGKPTYSFAVTWSLLVFYIFALQCVSTIAVVLRETRSLKWTIIQFLYMGTLAYLFSYLIFNMLK